MCLFYSLYHFLSLAVNHCHLLSLVVPLVVTRCTTCCHSLSFIVICCHSLPFVVTRCTTHCHSLSLVIIRCYSLSLDVPLVCLFINDVSSTDPAFAHLTLPISSFFICLPVRLRTTWNIKDVNFCSNKKWLTRAYFIHLRYAYAIMAFLGKQIPYSLPKP